MKQVFDRQTLRPGASPARLPDSPLLDAENLFAEFTKSEALRAMKKTEQTNIKLTVRDKDSMKATATAMGCSLTDYVVRLHRFFLAKLG